MAEQERELPPCYIVTVGWRASFDGQQYGQDIALTEDASVQDSLPDLSKMLKICAAESWARFKRDHVIGPADTFEH